MPSPEPGPSLAQAVALGLLQGPTELLPVSSSAHTSLLPWLAGWRYADLDGAARKSFEVALHVGAAAALAPALVAEVIALPRSAGGAARALRAPGALGLLALASVPAALAGAALRAPIERRLQGPRALATGLLAGSAAMVLADARPPAGTRALAELQPADALALGLAQAAALVPGVSRSGATLAAARARGFSRRDASALSWAVALPVLAGAGTLEGAALFRARRLPVALGAGALASFASTALSARALRRGVRAGLPLAPFAIYRSLLGLAVLSRVRRAARRSQ
jgi:undecaprenyl-diphosphatase